jgi:transposase
MKGVAMYYTIETLWYRYKNKSEIARQTGCDWKTVHKIVKNIEKGNKMPEKKSHPKILDEHKDKIIEFIENGLSGVRIHEEIQRFGVNVAYSTVKAYVADINKRENIFIRIHTAPGEEAQVDFGYVGLTPDNNGKKRKTWVFNMKLSYSRLDYYEKVYDQKVETFINCHINAFSYFGGIPEYVKIDNLKAAILEANFYEPIYQEMYKNFANYYGFRATPCRVYKPNDKGKVESGIKYIKGNFFAGRKFISEKDLDRRLQDWLDNKCNIRVHGTTRKIPKEVFENEEKVKLKALPIDKFKIAEIGIKYKVYHDCHIFMKYNYYSVPYEYVGKHVDIEVANNLVKIFYKGKNIAIHEVAEGRGNFKTSKSHYPKYKMYSKTEYQEKYQAKMSEVGEYAEQLFFFIMERKPNKWGRTVQGILSLQKKYSNEVVNLSCMRALSFSVDSYQTIKNICANGSYNLPCELRREELSYEHA